MLVLALLVGLASSCDLYVSEGTHGSECTSASPCGQIQQAINLAAPGATLCLQGMLGCGGVVNQSNLTITGQATLDCAAAGGNGLLVESSGLLITGLAVIHATEGAIMVRGPPTTAAVLHQQRQYYGCVNDDGTDQVCDVNDFDCTCPCGTCANAVQGFTIRMERLRIEDCNNPSGSGGVTVEFSGGGSQNQFVIEDVRLSNCTGRVAGGISVRMGYWVDYQLEGDNTNNKITVTNVQCSNCHATSASYSGGFAFAFLANNGQNSANELSLTDVSCDRCSGGNWNPIGGGAGAVAVAFMAYLGNQGNTVNVSSVSFVECSGGTYNSFGAGAAGIAVSYYAQESAPNSNNLVDVKGIVIQDCVGGNHNSYAGSAGLAVSHWGWQGNTGNVVNLHNSSMRNVTGGDFNTAAGASSFVSYFFSGGSNTANSQSLTVIKCTDCSGGTAAVSAIAQSQTATGAGVEGFSLTMAIATFERCESGADFADYENGNSGAVRVSMPLSTVDAQIVLHDVHLLNSSVLCTASLCAGALGVMYANLTINGSTFVDNSAIFDSSALFYGGPSSTLTISNSSFANNTAVSSEAATIKALSQQTVFDQVFVHAPTDGLVTVMTGQHDTHRWAIECPVGYQVTHAAQGVGRNRVAFSSCSPCPSGEYNFEAGLSVDSDPVRACKDCPPHSICSGGNSVVIRDSYWGEISNGSLVTIKVPNFNSRPEDVNFLNSTEQCNAGYTGVACTSCVDDWYPSSPLFCKSCPSHVGSMIVSLVVVVAKVSLAFYSARSAAIKNPAAEEEHHRAGSTLSALIQVAIAHCSLLGLMRDTDWSWDAMAHLSDSASHVGSIWDVGSTAFCFSEMTFRKAYWLEALFGPLLLFIAGLIGVSCVVRQKRLFGPKPDGMNSGAVFVEALMASLVVLTYIFMVRLVAHQVQVLSCVTLTDSLGNSESIMSYNPTEGCRPTEYWLTAIGLIGVYLAVLYYFNCHVLRKNYKQLNELSVKIRFAFLYRSFRPKRYWYGFVLLLRRLALEVVTILAPRSYDGVWGNCMISAVLVVSLVIHIEQQPFDRHSINILETASLATALLTVFCSQYLLSGWADFSVSNTLKETATALALIANSLLGIAFLAYSWSPIKAFYDKFQPIVKDRLSRLTAVENSDQQDAPEVFWRQSGDVPPLPSGSAIELHTNPVACEAVDSSGDRNQPQPNTTCASLRAESRGEQSAMQDDRLRDAKRCDLEAAEAKSQQLAEELKHVYRGSCAITTDKDTAIATEDAVHRI